MNWTSNKASTRKMILSVAVLCLTAVGLIIAAQFNSADASAATAANASAASPAAVFAGTNTGAIPDGLSGTPPQYGAPRTINFAVSGVSGNVTEVAVDFTATHSWVGDVEMILAAPGGSPSMHIASRIGVTTAGSFGDSSNFGGTYTFTDTAAGTNIWTAAAGTCGDTCAVPAGTYRTVGPGQTGQTNPAPVTSLNTTFGGLTPAQANGTWTLTFRDAASADIGSVSAANLTVNSATPAADGPIDFNGDGRTDYVVVRNVGGGPTGQVRWFYKLNGPGTEIAKDWGIATDFFLVGNIDGDNNDDIIVWRTGASGVAAFYALRSTNFTAYVEPFGQSGDDPTVIEDYNGDGKTDWAVYRSGALAGDPSTWFWRNSQTPGGAVNYVPWGQNGDFPAPGDYDGNGSADYVVQRNNGGGQARFWIRFSTGATDSIVWGTPTDVVVPGDYDGDGKTDIATVRGSGGAIQWWIRSSVSPPANPLPITFGVSATDFPTQGDYDGDGDVEPAIWRPNADPTMNFFYSLNSGGGATLQEWGQNGDYPVANFNSH